MPSETPKCECLGLCECEPFRPHTLGARRTERAESRADALRARFATLRQRVEGMKRPPDEHRMATVGCAWPNFCGLCAAESAIKTHNDALDTVLSLLDAEGAT